MRAYASNSAGTAYGNTVTFTSSPAPQLPTVTTGNVTSISNNSANCGGNVLSDGGSAVTLRGVCWSTSPSPTYFDNATYDGSGTGSYTSNLYGLLPNTTYYVRAYAYNSAGVGYGTTATFTTVSSSQLPNVITSSITSVTSNSAI